MTRESTKTPTECPASHVMVKESTLSNGITQKEYVDVTLVYISILIILS